MKHKVEPTGSVILVVDRTAKDDSGATRAEVDRAKALTLEEIDRRTLKLASRGPLDADAQRSVTILMTARAEIRAARGDAATADDRRDLARAEQLIAVGASEDCLNHPHFTPWVLYAAALRLVIGRGLD